MGTIIVGVILFGVVAAIIGNMIKNKKAGKSLQCGCGCEHCGGQCGHE